VKAILLVAGLLGARSDAAADLASDSLLKIRLEHYFRNPLEFPEPEFEINAAAEALRGAQIQRMIPAAPQPQPEPMRGDSWFALQPKETSRPVRNSGALWWLVWSTVLSLAFGACLSATGTLARMHRRRRRVKTVTRMMAGS
jgi:hypothetical protein